MVTNVLIVQRTIDPEYGNSWLVQYEQAGNRYENEFTDWGSVVTFVTKSMEPVPATKLDDDDTFNLDDIPF